MPKISRDLSLSCSKEFAFNLISSIDFMRSIDSNFGNCTTILFQNERMLRSVSHIERIGDVEIERVNVPETFTVITQRRKPMTPFLYQVSIQILLDNEEGALLKHINEFELDAENKHREEAILGIVEKNDVVNLKNIQRHIELESLDSDAKRKKTGSA